MEEQTKKYKKEPVEEKYLKAYLLGKEGEDRGKIYEVKIPSSAIGRKYWNILLNDEMISKKHTQIDKNLASINGTYINEKKLSYQKLEEGDTIKIGNTILKFLAKLL